MRLSFIISGFKDNNAFAKIIFAFLTTLKIINMADHTYNTQRRSSSFFLKFPLITLSIC